MRFRVLAAVLAALTLTGCAAGTPTRSSTMDSWVYQLQGYPGGRLDRLAAAPQRLAVIDLARDGRAGYFTAAEIAALRRSGKTVLAYFEVGSIENYRPEYAGLDGDLTLNAVDGWPGEYFVRYWTERWWTRVVRPRVDRALAAGYDGVYLDTLLAYEEIKLRRVPDSDRAGLASAAAGLVRRISAYAKGKRPGFRIFPQNSPELRRQPGYLAAIDGIGIEELYFQATDRPCRADHCASTLADIRRIRAAGRTVLAVDYATTPVHRRDACARYRAEGFAGTVTTVDLDHPAPPCPA